MTAPAAPPQAAVGRATGLVDLLLSVGYVDGELHRREQTFLHRYLDSVVMLAEELGGSVVAERARIRSTYQAHFAALYGKLEAEIRGMTADRQPDGNGGFVAPRVRDRALGLFRVMSRPEQANALELILAMMHADGVLSRGEQTLHDELMRAFKPLPAQAATLQSMQGVSAAAALPHGRPVKVEPVQWRALTSTAHPLLDPLEQTYSPHPIELQSQLALDFQLLSNAMQVWHRMRVPGNGMLANVTDIAKIPAGAQFLDNYVHVMRPRANTELVVLGDLHGCYACLKAALLQSNFVNRVWAHQWDPANFKDVKLVLLGDYIDRGRFSFDGVLRAVLHLFCAMPDHVVLLRGNHEYLLSHEGHVFSGVHPAEGLASIKPYVPREMLEMYKLVFEQMPTSLLFDRTLFVHGGVPRDDTFAARYRDLSSLNDPELRFQMLWSDPVPEDTVPVELQRSNARFNFGKQQFRAFMERIGCHTMIRGHEQIERGFDVIYDLGDRKLLNLFSAGGHDNRDLPVDSSYRGVTPMALTIQHDGEGQRAFPWPIHYQPFNYDVTNGFHRAQPLLEFRYQ